MAKNIADTETKPEAARLPTEKEFKSLIKKLTAAESELSELKGAMGSAVERAVASHNLHTDALRVVRKYIRKNPGQAAEFKLHLDCYWDYAKLGQPEDDLVESPKQRRGRMAKPETDAEDAPHTAGETMGRGTTAIRGGKVVSIKEAEQEAASA
jgi:hypothetical protein